MDASPTAGNPILVNLSRQNQWANLELIDACAVLDTAFLDAESPGTYGTIRTTLWHIIEAEHRFSAALAGQSVMALTPPAGWPAGELATLRVHAHDIGEALGAWAESVVGDPIMTGEWSFGPYAIPASVFAAQALQHGADHRSRIQLAMSRAGYEVPNLDAWSWWRTSLAVGQESATI